MLESVVIPRTTKSENPAGTFDGVAELLCCRRRRTGGVGRLDSSRAVRERGSGVDAASPPSPWLLTVLLGEPSMSSFSVYLRPRTEEKRVEVALDAYFPAVWAKAFSLNAHRSWPRGRLDEGDTASSVPLTWVQAFSLVTTPCKHAACHDSVSPLAYSRSRNKRPGGQPRLVGRVVSGVGWPSLSTRIRSMLATSLPRAPMIGRFPPAAPVAHLRPPQPGMQSSCGDWVTRVCALGSTTLVTPWRQSSAQSRGPPPLPCPNLWVPWCSSTWRGCGVLTVSQSTRCLPLEAADLESLLFLRPRARGER